MRIRYADDRETTSAIMKLMQVGMVGQASETFTPLGWEQMREFCTRTDTAALRNAAVASIAKDVTVHETQLDKGRRSSPTDRDST